MSLHTLANHLQTAGRGEDKVLVHMTPGEVHGLQSLAMAHGGSLTINPETGLPEAGFLSKILPIVAGLALGPAGAGIAFGGMSSAVSAGLLVGGATALGTGSLKNGLLAGLGAYGGAGLGAGMGAGAAAAGAAGAAGSAVPAAVGAGQALTGAGLAGSPAAVAGMTGAAAAPAAAAINPTADAIAKASGVFTPPAAPVAPVNTGYGAGQLAMQGGNVSTPLDLNQIAQQRAFAQQVAQTAPSKVLEEAAKSKGIFGGMDFAKLMNPDFIKENKGNYLAAMAPLFMEEERKKKEAQAASQMQLGGTPFYNPSPRAPGGSSERLYFADGGLANLPVENMSQQNTVGANTNYPMANLKPYGYAVPKNNPISQNVFQPDGYQNVDPYTGEQKLASGGIVALKKGGKAKAPAAPPPPKSEAQINEENAAKEYAAYLKDRNTDKAKEKAESDARIKELNTEYANRIKDFNKDTANELKQRQADIKRETDKEAKARMTQELKDWQSGRSSELKGIQTDLSSAIKDRTNEYTNRVKELDSEIKERQALRNFDASVFKAGYTEASGDVKGDDLGALSKAYDTGLSKQKSEMDKAKAALDAAKKTGIESLINRAQDVYNKESGDYNRAQEYKDTGISAFRDQTKRTQGLQARGYDQKTAQASGDASVIQAKIDAIKNNPAQNYMGGSQLSTEQEKQLKTLEGELSMAKQGKVVYDPKSGNYVPEKVTPTYSKLTKAPGLDTTKKIMEEGDIRRVYEELAGRSPTETEMNKYVGKKLSEADLSKNIGTLAELNMPQKFSNDDLNQQAQYYWGRDMTKGELAYFKDPANKVSNFNNLRSALTSSDAYLQNLNKINQAAFTSAQKQALSEEEGPATMEQIASSYQDVFGKPPTMEELIRLKESGANISALQEQIKGSPQYQEKLTKPFVPAISTPSAPAISQEQINAYRAQQIVPQAAAAPQPSPYIPTGPNVAQYNPFAVQSKSTIEGALPYSDISQRLGLTNLYSQLGEPGLDATKSEYGLPAAKSGLTASAPNIFGFDKYPTVEEALKAAQAAQQAPTGMASGGIAGYNLGGYSDGGRLLRGPGDGVSDSIPASIGDRQPARLADGEFVVPARIVSELGNGSTEAGARKLYAMMERVQRARTRTVGKGKVAVNSRADKMLPA
jgi:hypothetical protein